MAIMELKLIQELASIYQPPLILVFLDLRKAYETLYREHLLVSMDGYGVVPCLCGLLETFWYFQQVVPIHNDFYGTSFPATRFIA